MSGEVLTETSEGICAIQFFHPKGNSLPGNLLSGIEEAIQSAGQDDSVKVIVLRSKGDGAFCAGASFDELLALDNEDNAAHFFMGFGKVISAIKNVPKFVVCRVQGKAVGGGVGLIAAADYAVGTHQASIKLSELSLGFGPFVIAPAVQRKTGLTAFTNLTLQPKKWHSSQWALQHGLFNEVFETTESMDLALQTFVQELADYSNDATKAIKQMLWQGFEGFEADLLERAQLSGRLSQTETTQAILRQFKK